MTAILGIACFLTAYGPTIALLIFYISKQPQLILLALASACTWILTALLISIINLAHPSTIALIIISAIIQEIHRGILYWGFSKIHDLLEQIAPTKSKLNIIHYYFSIGFGIGLVSALIHYISPLSQSFGPGILFCKSCSVDVFFMGGIYI